MRLRSVLSFSSGTLISRLLGLVREGMIALLLGGGKAADAFYVAFRIPNLLRDLLAENAVNAAFLPAYLWAREKGADERRFAGTVLTLVLVLSGGLVVLGMLFTPAVVTAIAYGFRNDPLRFRLTVDLTRITLPYLTLVALAALVGGLLNALRRFFVPAFSPVFFNLGVILAGGVAHFLLPPSRYGHALAFGVLLGGSLQLLFQLPFLKANPGLPRPALALSHPALDRFRRLLGPVVLSTALSRLSLFVNTLIASFLMPGSIAYLNYAFRIMHLPLGLFGVGVATVSLPDLAPRAARGEDLRAPLWYALALTLFLTLGPSLYLLLGGEKIVALLYQRGAFGTADTLFVTAALAFYALNILPASLSKVLLNLFFVRGEAAVPNRSFLLGTLVNLTMAFSLPWFLDFPGLALATALGSWGQLFYLIREARLGLPPSSLRLPLFLPFLGSLLFLTAVSATDALSLPLLPKVGLDLLLGVLLYLPAGLPFLRRSSNL